MIAHVAYSVGMIQIYLFTSNLNTLQIDTKSLLGHIENIARSSKSAATLVVDNNLIKELPSTGATLNAKVTLNTSLKQSLFSVKYFSRPRAVSY